MSAEHGHAGHQAEVTFTDIIADLFLMFLMVRAITEPIEDVVEHVVTGGGHGSGHH